MNIARIDHFVLTVADIDRTIRFYTEALMMGVQRFGTAETPRVALTFGQQKNQSACGARSSRSECIEAHTG